MLPEKAGNIYMPEDSQTNSSLFNFWVESLDV